MIWQLRKVRRFLGESLFDLIVTVERWKKYLIPTVEYLGPWKIFALSRNGDIMVNWKVQGISVKRGLLWNLIK